ncbi:hypothetical protein BC829DRAFT_387894 [Chytridium lagenaria]|nr:hypothetical protein BC829DRAFT_387894 [Chytridium lagenaria]
MTGPEELPPPYYTAYPTTTSPHPHPPPSPKFRQPIHSHTTSTSAPKATSTVSTKQTGPVSIQSWIIPQPHLSRLLVGSGVNLRSISATNGTHIYENPLTGMGYGQVVMADAPGAAYTRGILGSRLQPTKPRYGVSKDDVVFVCNGCRVKAVRISDGKDLWDFEPGFMKRGNVGDMLVDGDMFIYAIDVYSGKKVQFPLFQKKKQTGVLGDVDSNWFGVGVECCYPGMVLYNVGHNGRSAFSLCLDLNALPSYFLITCKTFRLPSC